MNPTVAEELGGLERIAFHNPQPITHNITIPHASHRLLHSRIRREPPGGDGNRDAHEHELPFDGKGRAGICQGGAPVGVAVWRGARRAWDGAGAFSLAVPFALEDLWGGPTWAGHVL